MATKKANKEVMNVSVELTSAQANAPEVAQAEPTQVELRDAMKKRKNVHDFSKKYELACKKDILNKLGRLSQVLKMFDGIHTQKLKECDGLTVEDWMDAHGVHRFVTKSGTKKGYTPALVMAGWHEKMKEGNRAFMFKSVKGSFVPNQEEMATWGLMNQKAMSVYTLEEAKKLDGKPIRRHVLVEIGQTEWTAAKILDVLIQKREYEKHEEKRASGQEAWDNLEHVYVVRYDQDAEGKITKRIIEVDKNRVTF